MYDFTIEKSLKFAQKMWPSHGKISNKQWDDISYFCCVQLIMITKTWTTVYLVLLS